MALGGGNFTSQNKELPGAYINFVSAASTSAKLSDRGIATMPLMALGGGNFTSQNKELPGAYINFVSAASTSAKLSDRGIATMPLELDWGKEGEVFEVANEDFQKDSMKIFGYAFDSPKMKGLCDLFMGAKTLYAYRLNGGGVKASNNFATALYCGTRGNDIKIVIQANADETKKFDVITYLGTEKVDIQTATNAKELKANDYVTFKADAQLAATAATPQANADETKKFDVITYLGTVKVDEQTVENAKELTANDYVTFKTDAELQVTAATPLSGGTNGTADGTAHKAYLDKIESYTYNTMGVVVTDETTKKLYAAFNKRLRDEMGIKFQTVLYNLAADNMGVINVKNRTTDEGHSEASLVYWVTGAECGCPVNKSCQNKKYDGAFAIQTDYTQTELKKAIKNGEFVLHRVNADIRVLEDINSMVTVTDTCGEVFKENQTIRVIDQLGNDDAVLFNTKYLGVVPNNASGRTSLWADLVKIRQALQDMGAIENFTDSDVTVVFNTKYLGVVPNNASGRTSLWADLVKIRQALQDMGAIENFTDSDVTVVAGDSKKSVVVTSLIEVVNAMSKLYMTVTVA